MSGTITLFRDLRPSERLFVVAMHELHFGRFEGLRIMNGELSLADTVIRLVKFGSDQPTPVSLTESCGLKHQVTEFLEYVRSVADGEIRCLEVRHGIPFSMEVAEGAHDHLGVEHE